MHYFLQNLILFQALYRYLILYVDARHLLENQLEVESSCRTKSEKYSLHKINNRYFFYLVHYSFNGKPIFYNLYKA